MIKRADDADILVDISSLHRGGVAALTWNADRDFEFHAPQLPGVEGGTNERLRGTLRRTDPLCERLVDSTTVDASGTCVRCQDIPTLLDYQGRVRRLASRAHSAEQQDETKEQDETKGNVRYMTQDQVIEKSARQSLVIRKLRRERRWIIFDNVALRVRLRDLKSAAQESAIRGDVRKLIDDLTECAKDGKFESKQALLHFFMDAARGLNLATVGEDGELKMSRGMQWHESTHRIFEVLKHYGGPRSHRWVESNLIGMHLRTTEKRWSKALHPYSFGLNVATFVVLRQFYIDVSGAGCMTHPRHTHTRITLMS